MAPSLGGNTSSPTASPKNSFSSAKATIPNQNDVLFGRGGVITSHPGNQFYRSLVQAQKPTFVSLPRKKDKRAIADNILKQIRNLHPSGRFLIEDDTGLERISSTGSANDDGAGCHPLVLHKVWVQVSDEKATEKILHRLREKDKEPVASSRSSTSKKNNTSNNEEKEAACTNNLEEGKTTNLAEGGEEESVGQFDDLFQQVYSNTGEEEKEVGQYDGLFDSTEDLFGNLGGDNNTTTLEEECGSLDDGLGELSLEQVCHVANEQQQLHELTLQQWALVSRSKFLNFDATSHMASGQGPGYIKTSLSAALKLTDFLIEAEREEKNGHGNPVPLESIRVKNVLIRSKERAGEAQQETVEYVWIMSSMGENPATGTVSARLYAMGKILYELFAGDESTLPSHDDTTVGCIDLMNEDGKNNHQQQRQRSSWQSTYSEGTPSNYIDRLATEGVPLSIRTLIKNLLNCGQGDFCDGDDTYTSFHDLRQDLSIMLADPSRFLDDLQVSNGLPTLEICDKLYGRESEEAKLDQFYEHHTKLTRFQGVVISGGAGVGKSRLAMHIQKLTNEANGYFCAAKFQQNNMHVKPLANIGTIFNTLCDKFAEDASPLQLKSVSDELANALGNQAGLLAGVVTSLPKLMHLSIQLEETSRTCVDAPTSMRYLFGELLCIISSHSRRPISLLMDDIQFADSSSLLLIGNLLFSAVKCDSPVFFAFCHRDDNTDEDEVSRNVAFSAWLSSISMFALEGIKLNNMTSEGVNSLISDALHLSPRITRPLSEVLHHKTMGNPLFVRQLLGSLMGQGYIYVDLSQPRWAWDLNKIADQEISESVLDLLMKEMKRLPTDLQLGLKVASCLGSCSEKNVLDILSKDVGMEDLLGIMQQVSKKGFMDIEHDGARFTFVHDKIQQAAYELMSEQERRKNHMQYGMALCSHTLNNSTDSNELFFTAITQINHGGPSVVSDPNQKRILAQLNLKAGRLFIVLSDYASALSLFEHGISYLGEDKWASQYELTLNLFDAAAEAACVLNKNAAVTSYTEEIVAHAKSFDDSLHCLAVAAKSLHHAELLQASMSSSLDTLSKLGEKPPREISDPSLKADMLAMNEMMRNTSDDYILNMQEKNNSKRIVTTLKLYSNLAYVLHFVKPSLICAVSLRMVELKMAHGLIHSSPGAFALYGGVLVAAGNIIEGCRFGRLALKLVEKKDASMHKSTIIAGVYLRILWTVQPLQSIAEAHCLGRRIGQQTGDVLHTTLNWQQSITTSYIAGACLDKVKANSADFIQTMQSQKIRTLVGNSIFLFHQTSVLKGGLHDVLDEGEGSNIPTEQEALCQYSNPSVVAANNVHQLVRAYLFRQLDHLSLDTIGISDDIERNKYLLRPLVIYGLFFEGLASYLLARQRDGSEQRARWIGKGESVLTKMKYWSEHSSWNWESKMVLLEAEKMYTVGNFEQASLFYERAIHSAHEHKFINDEAIASELAGVFFCKRELHAKAQAILLHSVKSYKTWGALAVAKRVETFIANKYGSDCLQQRHIAGDCTIATSDSTSMKKRPL